MNADKVLRGEVVSRRGGMTATMVPPVGRMTTVQLPTFTPTHLLIEWNAVWNAVCLLRVLNVLETKAYQTF